MIVPSDRTCMVSQGWDLPKYIINYSMLVLGWPWGWSAKIYDLVEDLSACGVFGLCPTTRLRNYHWANGNASKCLEWKPLPSTTSLLKCSMLVFQKSRILNPAYGTAEETSLLTQLSLDGWSCCAGCLNLQSVSSRRSEAGATLECGAERTGLLRISPLYHTWTFYRPRFLETHFKKHALISLARC